MAPDHRRPRELTPRLEPLEGRIAPSGAGTPSAIFSAPVLFKNLYGDYPPSRILLLEDGRHDAGYSRPTHVDTPFGPLDMEW